MINPTNIDSSVVNMEGSKFFELQRKIKSMQETKTDEEKLMKVAGEFEAVFVKKMIDVMDSTVERSGFMSGGKGEETFKSMLHQEIALKISTNPASSLGMAKQMYEQMKNRL